MAQDADEGDVFDTRYPARQVLELIADKWTPIVLYALAPGVRRYGQLQRQIPDVSKKMLAQTLRQLEADGLVTRTAHPEVPPRVEYALTPLGVKLVEPVVALCDWAKRHQAELAAVHRNRQRARRGKGPGRTTG